MLGFDFFKSQYKLYVLSLTGNTISSFVPDPEPAFGIRNVAWHPSGMFLAVGGWDDKVKLTHLSYPSHLIVVIGAYSGLPDLASCDHS